MNKYLPTILWQQEKNACLLQSLTDLSEQPPDSMSVVVSENLKLSSHQNVFSRMKDGRLFPAPPQQCFLHISWNRKAALIMESAWILFNLSKDCGSLTQTGLSYWSLLGRFSLPDERNQTWRLIRDYESLNLHLDGLETDVSGCFFFYTLDSAVHCIKHGICLLRSSII